VLRPVSTGAIWLPSCVKGCTMPDFLPDLPVDLIVESLKKSPGNELSSGKFDSPESSAALVANAFGWFLQRLDLLPCHPHHADRD
jgi:hypothetical protein